MEKADPQSGVEVSVNRDKSGWIVETLDVMRRTLSL